MLVRYSVFSVNFLVPDKFLMKVFRRIFYKLCIPCWCKAKKPKVDLYKILNIYPHIHFMNKGLSIVQKLHVQCD